MRGTPSPYPLAGEMISPAPLIVWKLARLAGKLPDQMGVKGLIRQKAGWTPEVFRRCPKGEAHNAPSQSIPLRGGLEGFHPS